MAADLAGEIGSHRAAWSVLAELAEVEAASGQEDASRSHVVQARSALDDLLKGIDNELQWEGFKARQDVKALLEVAGLIDGEHG